MYVMPHTRILYSALLFFVSLVLFAQKPSTEAFSDLIFPDGKSLEDAPRSRKKNRCLQRTLKSYGQYPKTILN